MAVDSSVPTKASTATFSRWFRSSLKSTGKAPANSSAPSIQCSSTSFSLMWSVNCRAASPAAGQTWAAPFHAIDATSAISMMPTLGCSLRKRKLTYANPAASVTRMATRSKAVSGRPG